MSQPEPSILDRARPATVGYPLKMFIYGPAGAGKTVFAASAPDPIFLDIERSTTSLLNHPEFHNIPVLPIDKFSELNAVFLALKAGERPDRKTVVIDTVSETQKRVLDEQIDNAWEASSGKRDRFLPQQQDYNKNTEIMRRLIWQYRDLDRNLIILGHEREEKIEATGNVIIRPDLTQKLNKTIEEIVDVVGYMTSEWAMVDGVAVEVRRLQIKPDRRVHAKTRIGGLPPILENPTVQTFIDAKQAQGANRKESVA